MLIGYSFNTYTNTSMSNLIFFNYSIKIVITVCEFMLIKSGNINTNISEYIIIEA